MPSFFPRRFVALSTDSARWFWFGLVFALFPLGAYYGWGWLRGEDFSALVMYRPGIGDRDYFPLARQFAAGNFGDGYTAGFIGVGWVGFPCFSVLPHGLALRAFGSAGFAVADILTPVVYYILVARLLFHAGLPTKPAIWFALFLTLHGFQTLADTLFHVFGYALRGLPFFLSFLQSWEFRFPRNFVSDIYAVGALGNWCVLARQGPELPVRWWIGTAIWMSAVLQSDIYTFIALALAFAAMAILWGDRVRLLPKRSLVKNAAWLIVVGLAVSLPFLLQRAHASPALLERFGVFPVARAELGRFVGLAWNYFPKSFLLATLALPWLVWTSLRLVGITDLLPTRLAWALTLLQVAGFSALPVFVAATGQAIQVYHFRDTARMIFALSVSVALALLLVALWRQSSRAAHSSRGLTNLRRAVLVISPFALLVPHFAHAQKHLDITGLPRPLTTVPAQMSARYRADFSALAVELDRAALNGANVLATIDVELFAWWTGLRGRESFLAHSFVSSLGSEILFERLARFAHDCRIAPADFVPWLLAQGADQVGGVWLFANRYQATALHTFAPLAEYTTDERARIAAADPLDSWHTIVPEIERLRLRDAYETAASLPRSRATPAPDLLVLTCESADLHPDSAKFELRYENPTFRLFRRR